MALGLWLATAALVLIPLGAIVVLAVRGGEFGVLLQGEVLEASVNSLVSAVGSAVAAVAVGTALAVLCERTDLAGRRALRLFAFSPMLIPPFVGAIAWLGIAGPSSPLNLWWRSMFGGPLWSVYGADGVILLLTVHSYPIVMLIVTAALRRIPADLEQAARISGAGPVRSLLTVTVPLLRPALVSSFVLVAVGNLADFGIPSIIGLPERFTTLATLVYRYLQSGTVDNPLGVVAAIGVVLIVIALIGLLADARIGKPRVELDASASRAEALSLGRARVPVSIVTWLAVLAVTVLPLLALLMQTLLRAPGVPLAFENLTLDHLVEAVTSANALTGATNSVLLAVGAAIVCGVLGLAIGVVGTRTRVVGSRAMHAVMMLPQAVPGIVIGVAWLVLAPRIGLFNTPWLILCAYITSFTAIVLQAVTAPLAGTPSSAEEAARISGAGPLRALADISARLAAPAAISGAVLVAVTAVRELTLSVLLLSPGSQTLGVAIFNLQQAGAFSTASALSLVVALLGLAVIGLATGRVTSGGAGSKGM
ncbi:ABC transporter permease [Gulosibacter faecalis]|uniref:ABC transporter permease n=1 Tax=Gulosibacter faecalis TaxID=272240 RepID=A0ABW5UUN9_9MICO|nr:iron ABC transporter permease [Gulosibacter faecalis]